MYAQTTTFVFWKYRKGYSAQQCLILMTEKFYERYPK